MKAAASQALLLQKGRVQSKDDLKEGRKHRYLLSSLASQPFASFLCP
jgi:hypothetical protein